MEEKEIKKAVKFLFSGLDEKLIERELGEPIGEVRKIVREYLHKQKDPLSAIFESGAYDGLTLKPTSTPYKELSKIDEKLYEDEEIRRSALQGELHKDEGMLKRAISIVFDGDERTDVLLKLMAKKENDFGTYMSPDLVASNEFNGKVMRSGLADFLVCISYLYDPIMVPLPPGHYTLQEIAFISELAKEGHIVPILTFNYKLYDFCLLDIIKDVPYISQGLHSLLMYSGYNSNYNRKLPEHRNIYNFLSSDLTIKKEIWPGLVSHIQDTMVSLKPTSDSYSEFRRTHRMTGELEEFFSFVSDSFEIFEMGKKKLSLKLAPNHLLKEPFELVKILSELKENTKDLREDIITNQNNIISKIKNRKTKPIELMNELPRKYEDLDKVCGEYGLGNGKESIRTSIIDFRLGILHSFAPFVGSSFTDKETKVIQNLNHILEKYPHPTFNQNWEH